MNFCTFYLQIFILIVILNIFTYFKHFERKFENVTLCLILSSSCAHLLLRNYIFRLLRSDLLPGELYQPLQKWPGLWIMGKCLLLQLRIHIHLFHHLLRNVPRLIPHAYLRAITLHLELLTHLLRLLNHPIHYHRLLR